MNLYTVTVTEQNTEFLKTLCSAIQASIASEIERQSALISSKTKQRYFTKPYGMMSANSEMAKSFETLPTQVSGDSVVGGFSMGKKVPFADTFIGPYGRVTTIRAKRKQALAIPLTAEAYNFQKGVSSLLNVQDMVRIKDVLYSKKGNSLTPMYVLRKSVNVKTQIDPDIVAYQNLMPVTMAIRKSVFETIGRFV